MIFQDKSIFCGCNDRNMFPVLLVTFPLIRGGAT